MARSRTSAVCRSRLPSCKLDLRLGPQEEVERVMKYLHEADRKRSLVSQLMQRAACHRAVGVPFRKAKISRTKGGKPFLVRTNQAFACHLFLRPRGADWHASVCRI